MLFHNDAYIWFAPQFSVDEISQYLSEAAGLFGKEFTFQHLETEADIEQHLELMRTVFGQDSRIDLLVKKWMDHHPAMALKDFFVVKRLGMIVAALNLIPSKWTIGGILLKVAELGCVATLPKYRHKGLQRMLMEEYHKQVLKQEYDLSAIEGIPNYYRQFGYEYALPLLEETRIRLDQIPDYESRHTIRPFTSDDVPKAMRLLDHTQRKLYVHTVRERDIWKMQQETKMISEYEYEGYAVEEDGKMIAYFRISENPAEKQLFLREITDVDQTTAQSTLRFLKGEGKKRKLETLAAMISYHEPFTEQVVAIGGTKQTPYAWQMRVTDYVKMFRKLTPLLEKRLASSTFCRLTEKVNFNFYQYTIQLTIEDGKIKNVQRLETSEDRMIRADPLVFTQLLLGYRSREELETIYPDFLVKVSYRHLVDILFPEMPSYIHTDY
jgi:predicted acetyltransferase